MIYGYNDDNGIANFNALEFAILGALYCAIMFYRTVAGKEFLDRIFSGCIRRVWFDVEMEWVAGLAASCSYMLLDYTHSTLFFVL